MATAAVNFIPKGFNSVTPYLIVQGAPQFIEFLKQAFGAEENLRVPRPDGTIMHAQMKVGDSILELADGSEQYPSRPANIHLYLEDTDAAYERALQAGATSIGQPEDRPYGERSGGVKDPAGNKWYIATHLQGSSHIPEGLRAVTPYLHVRGADRLIEFLKQAFGAAEAGVYREPADGPIVHAKIRVGDTIVEMGEAHGPYQPMPFGLHYYVPDVDAVLPARARSRRDLAIAARRPALWRAQRDRHRPGGKLLVHSDAAARAKIAASVRNSISSSSTPAAAIALPPTRSRRSSSSSSGPGISAWSTCRKCSTQLDIFRKITSLRLEDVYNLLLKKGWTLGSPQLTAAMHLIIRIYHPAQVKLLKKFWAESQPDLLVSLIPNFNRALYESLEGRAPMVTILTDLADYPPHFWIERAAAVFYLRDRARRRAGPRNGLRAGPDLQNLRHDPAPEILRAGGSRSQRRAL